MNGCWKLPVAYFLIDGLGGCEKANIVKRCLKFIYESGAEVSLTFDGTALNIAYVISNERILKYVLAYKFSQDHLEVFF